MVPAPATSSRPAAEVAWATPRSPSTKRKAPGFALLGQLGEHLDVVLELKSVADVALVGFPNAGKSLAGGRDVGGQAQDRRLPVHDAGPQPRRRDRR